MTTVLVPERILDTRHRQIVNGKAVVVEDGRIKAVAARADAPDGAAVIDLPDHTLLPGLIDCHTHLIGQIDNGQGYAQLVTRSAAQEVLEGVRHAAEMLDCGFTTVRDVGTFRAFADVALREAIDTGWVRGPRMQCAGAYVTSPGGAGDITGLAVDTDQIVPPDLRFGVVSGVDQTRATVRQILGRGANLIKVIATGAPQTLGTNPASPELTADEIRAAVEIASEHGVHVAAHAHGADSVKRAVRAGARSIEHGSLLHDIGKLKIPDHILLKKAKLTDDEFEIMRQHARYGYEFLSGIQFLKTAADIVYSHHERFDGAGYPRRLGREEIPLGARLFAIVDSVDAMIYDRPYHRAITFAEAAAEIRRCAGGQFDPEYTELALDYLRRHLPAEKVLSLDLEKSLPT